jgi:PilZ domain
MDQPVADRRLDTRFGQPAIAKTQAILRPGCAVSLVDLSYGGALIEGPRPLRPGARVYLQLTTGTRRLGIGATVLRCSVASLDPRHGVQYRGALKFDHRCEALWEAGTLDGYLFPGVKSGADRTLTDATGQSLPVFRAAVEERTVRDPE